MLREVTYFPSRPAKGESIHLKGHTHRRLINRKRRQCLGYRRFAERVRDIERVDACHANDVARLGAIRIDPLQTHIPHDLKHLATAALTLTIDHLPL
jgi:hypothetical protein